MAETKAPAEIKKDRFTHRLALADTKTPIFTLARVLFAFVFKLIYPMKYVGQEHLDALNAPFILMGNHETMMDPIIAAFAVKKHEINFLGKRELAKVPVVGRLLMAMHMIPVDRHASDMEAMRTCMKVTRSGGVLGIFPEGTRHVEGTMEHMESGVALIALRSGVPLVPMYIPGKPRLFRRMNIVIGEPIQMDDLRAEGVNKETCALLLERIQGSYALLTGTRTEA